jgi:hypothetical protein
LLFIANIAGQFIYNIAGALFLCVESRLEKIRKKKQFHHQKHHRKLYDDDCPKSFSNGHLSEPFVVKPKYPYKNIHFLYLLSTVKSNNIFNIGTKNQDDKNQDLGLAILALDFKSSVLILEILALGS